MLLLLLSILSVNYVMIEQNNTQFYDCREGYTRTTKEERNKKENGSETK